MLRARWRSRGKDLDDVLAEAREAMLAVEPDLRLVGLHRALGQVGYLRKREPERGPKVHAALLDVTLEALDAFARREPQLAAGLASQREIYENWRAGLGAGEDFEDEVEAIRTTLYR